MLRIHEIDRDDAKVETHGMPRDRAEGFEDGIYGRSRITVGIGIERMVAPVTWGVDASSA
ncbi:MAG: hypothetical protein AVDCRST_MAG19-98 [uncultured Thermomicrobiales bacterium]|uniref:Uncharacterized protein n=1 Tax=uncultured Thermomicrobiales bacterium TaxID=1645740 RepID=A0A6J4U9K4_9BACT|nr:MAG: hypothetical protein AVDCRST_MAG19-98 [uncultured Thermomicrobiales bacterium]